MISDEQLDDIEAKAKKAVRGPWCTSLNAEEVMGREYPDWGCVYANITFPSGNLIEGAQLLSVNSHMTSEEELDREREKYFKSGGKYKSNPGPMGDNAEYIASACPDIVLEMIAEIRRLRKSNADIFHLKVPGNLKMFLWGLTDMISRENGEKVTQSQALEIAIREAIERRKQKNDNE